MKSQHANGEAWSFVCTSVRKAKAKRLQLNHGPRAEALPSILDFETSYPKPCSGRSFYPATPPQRQCARCPAKYIAGGMHHLALDCEIASAAPLLSILWLKGLMLCIQYIYGRALLILILVQDKPARDMLTEVTACKAALAHDFAAVTISKAGCCLEILPKQQP